MKKGLIFADIMIWIIIVIGICFLFINPYFILKNWFKEDLKITNKNRETVEHLIQKSEYYHPEKSFDEVEKIQFFLVFNDFEFILYYNDGTEYTVFDDHLDDLTKYIHKNGYSKAGVLFKLGIADIVLCLILNEIRKNISKKVELIERQESYEDT